MEFDNNQNHTNTSINYVREIANWFLTILIALVIAMLIKAFIFVPIQVKMVSMQDTLFDGQRLIVYKLGYYFSPPKQGDIIIFEHREGNFKGWMKFLPVPNPGEEDYIKRVVAVAGEEVDIRDDGVYVNKKKLDEPYTKGITNGGSQKYPFTVPKNTIFVMGDNREHSTDSRVLGCIGLDKVRGKAVVRIWPLKKFGGIYGNLRND